MQIFFFFFHLHLNLSSVSGGKFALYIFLSKTMLLNISLLIMVRSLFVSILFLFFLFLFHSVFRNQSVVFSLHFLNIALASFKFLTWFVAFTLFIKSHFYYSNSRGCFFHTTKKNLTYTCITLVRTHWWIWLFGTKTEKKNVHFLNCKR